MRGSLGIFRDYTPGLESRRNTNELFVTYLAGLIEGDGYIGIPTYVGKRDTKGRLVYPTIQISYKKKDIPLAMIIQKEIGYGSISKKKGVSGIVYTINSEEGIRKVVK